VDGVGGDVQLLRVGRGASRGGGGDLGLGGRGQVGHCACGFTPAFGRVVSHPCRKGRVMDGAPGRLVVAPVASLRPSAEWSPPMPQRARHGWGTRPSAGSSPCMPQERVMDGAPGGCAWAFVRTGMHAAKCVSWGPVLRDSVPKPV
jgi:hypothetical protein